MIICCSVNRTLCVKDVIEKRASFWEQERSIFLSSRKQPHSWTKVDLQRFIWWFRICLFVDSHLRWIQWIMEAKSLHRIPQRKALTPSFLIMSSQTSCDSDRCGIIGIWTRLQNGRCTACNTVWTSSGPSSWFCSPVEGHHAAGDGHIHGHLSGHAANQQHLLPRVWMERRVENVFGPPELVFRQTRSHHTLSGEQRRKEKMKIVYDKHETY